MCIMYECVCACMLHRACTCVCVCACSRCCVVWPVPPVNAPERVRAFRFFFRYTAEFSTSMHVPKDLRRVYVFGGVDSTFKFYAP